MASLEHFVFIGTDPWEIYIASRVACLQYAACGIRTPVSTGELSFKPSCCVKGDVASRGGLPEPSHGLHVRHLREPREAGAEPSSREELGPRVSIDAGRQDRVF